MEEYVCADGRMSVNGVCFLSRLNDQRDPPAIIPKKEFDDEYESIEDIKIKDKFEWNFDKVGDTVKDFGESIRNSVTEFNGYVENKFGIDNAAGRMVLGAALPPTVSIPFGILQGIAASQKAKRDEIQRIENVTNQDTQGDIKTIDMMTYDIPTAGQGGFNIHNDSYDNNNQSTGGEASYNNAASTGAKDGFGYGL